MIEKTSAEAVNKAKKTISKSGKPKELKGIAQKAIKELERIAFCEDEPIKIRMDILKWFTELDIGKPRASSDEENKTDRVFDIRVCVEE